MKMLSCMIALACLAAVAPAAAQQAIPSFVNAAGAPERLLQQMLDAPADSATTAVMEAFAFAGVATRDGVPFVRASVGPALPYHIRSIEARQLVADIRARRRGEFRTSLADVGAALVDLGWRPQSNDDPGRALATVLIYAIGEAEEISGDPEAFVPLFLRESARMFNPGAGLAALELAPETLDPSTVLLSDLELQLLFAMLMRGDPALRMGSVDPSPSGYESRDWLAQPSGPWAREALVVAGPTPCSDWLEELPEEARPDGSYLADSGSGWLIDKAMGMAGETAGTVASGISVLFKLAKIMSTTIDRSVLFELEASTDSAHYRPKGALQDAEHLSFTAQVELGPEADRWAEDPILGDCLKFMGFSVPDGRDALIKAIGDWKIVWGVDRLNGHATFSRAKNPDFATHTVFTKPLSSDNGVWTSSLVVDMAEEKHDIQPGQPVIERYGKIPMYAKLDQSQPPDYSMIMKGIAAGAAFGGPVGSGIFTFAGLTLDVLEGLWQKFTARTAAKPVVAVWNEPGPGGWYGQIEMVRNMTIASDTSYATVTGNSQRKMSLSDVERVLIRVVPEIVEDGSPATVSRTMQMESLSVDDETVGCRAPHNNQQYVRKAYTARAEEHTTIKGMGSGPTHVSVGVRDDGTYEIHVAGLPEIEQEAKYSTHRTYTGGCERIPPVTEAGNGRYFEEITGFIPLDISGKAEPGARALSGRKDALNWKVSWSLNWKGEGAPR